MVMCRVGWGGGLVWAACLGWWRRRGVMTRWCMSGRRSVGRRWLTTSGLTASVLVGSVGGVGVGGDVRSSGVSPVPGTPRRHRRRRRRQCCGAGWAGRWRYHRWRRAALDYGWRPGARVRSARDISDRWEAAVRWS